ncbi:YadA C-terminal domain-containing protein [Fusobacterium necrophorum]|nr:YadA C-terminal domain-containing protein [Fusobacterium necrophorum]EYD69365.1 cell surface protein [Fusobacterium necrophorum subsp. funduliforme B35]
MVLEKRKMGKYGVIVSTIGIFALTSSSGFASSKPLQEKYSKNYFENKVSKSINDVVDDNFPRTYFSFIPNPINVGIRTQVKTIFNTFDKYVPTFIKPLIDLTGYGLSTFPDKKIFHSKGIHGERVAEEFQKTNKAFNEAEKKWAETANFVMKNKSVLEEHNQKIVKNESEIGELRTNVENNYYTKEDTYSKVEVNTQLETKVDKKEFHDYQNDVKKEMETSKSELRTEVNTQLDTKVDKKEFYDYQNDVKKDIENTKSELRHVGSLSAALSGLHPMQYDKNNPNQVMASLGSYKDKQAVAVGLTHYFKENLMMTGGIALADDKKVKTMASLGITYKFGKGGESSEDEDLKKMVQAQAQEIQEMKEQLRVLMSK